RGSAELVSLPGHGPVPLALYGRRRRATSCPMVELMLVPAVPVLGPVAPAAPSVSSAISLVVPLPLGAPRSQRSTIPLGGVIVVLTVTPPKNTSRSPAVVVVTE